MSVKLVEIEMLLKLIELSATVAPKRKKYVLDVVNNLLNQKLLNLNR